jgi:multidrug efflux pump subunit AcrA (membrane-fusion protein)
VQTALRKDALKIPSAALRFVPPGVKRERDAQIVYTLNAQNQLTPHRIQTGITDGRFIELVSGDLHEGDALVDAEVRRK